MIKITKESFKLLYDIACEDWKPKLEEKLKPFIFSDTIEFTQEFFEEMRKACTEDQLKVFNVIFKKYLPKENELFSITTYEEVCEKLKEKELTISDFKQFGIDKEKLFNIAKLQQIARLFNGDWKAKFDGKQYNYYPYFVCSGGGLGFLGSTWYHGDFYGMVVYFKDAKTATYVGKTFIDVYKLIL